MQTGTNGDILSCPSTVKSGKYSYSQLSMTSNTSVASSPSTISTVPTEDTVIVSHQNTCQELTDWGNSVPQAKSLRRGWTRRLVVTKQPLSEFYKDEGGKSNALDVEVTLVEFDELGEPARTPDAEFVDMPLRILLFFESGKRVDDTDQEIFRFVGNDYDSVVIKAATRKAIIQFRLEKVSRRKDGQRFKLRIEVDQEQCTANVDDLSPIFTNAICVLSKRKHHSSHDTFGSDPASRHLRQPPHKLQRRDIDRLENKLYSKFDMVFDKIEHLSQLIERQNALIFCSNPIVCSQSENNGLGNKSTDMTINSFIGDDLFPPSQSQQMITLNDTSLPLMPLPFDFGNDLGESLSFEDEK